MSSEIEHFQRVCRYCLVPLDSDNAAECLADIFANTEDSSNRNLAYIIETCIESKKNAATNFKFPLIICDKCTSTLRVFSGFRMKCKEALNFLHETLANDKCHSKILSADNVKPSTAKITSTVERTHLPCITDSAIRKPSEEDSSYVISNMDRTITESTTSSLHSNISGLFQDNASHVVAGSSGTEKVKTECPECGVFVVNFRKHLETHKSVVDRKRPYVCELCQRAYINRASYLGHLNQHKNVRPYACEKCGKTFHGPANLRMHLISHESARKFQCSDCSKNFRYCHDLATHRRVHTQNPIYACEHCEYTNVKPQNLKRHARIHNSEYRFTCEHCTKGFNRMEYYRNHVQNNRCKPDNKSGQPKETISVGNVTESSATRTSCS